MFLVHNYLKVTFINFCKHPALASSSHDMLAFDTNAEDAGKLNHKV